MSILTVPARLALMLVDAHPSITNAYHYTRSNIDLANRPCWLVFIEDEAYPQESAGEELAEQGYSLAYIGKTYSDPSGTESQRYEQEAREVAVATVRYFLEHPMLQVANRRGLLDGPQTSLSGVNRTRLDRRSGVTLYTRDGVDAGAFWGFTIELTVINQIVYNETGIP